MLIFTGAMVLLVALWLNLDVSAKVLWMKGQRLRSIDSHSAAQTLHRARVLSPLLPGLARDQAGVLLTAYLTTDIDKDFRLAGVAIEKARELNRLDTVPLRMEADLLAGRASRHPELAKELLTSARKKLGKAMELEPFNALILLRMGELSRKLGEGDAALKFVVGSLEAEPNYLRAHRLRISLLEELDPGAVDEALGQLELARADVDGYRPISAYERIVIEGAPGP